MNTIILAQWLAIGFLTAIAVSDILLIRDKTNTTDSYSEQIKAASQYHLWLPVGSGVVLGHWFAPHVKGIPAAAPLLLLALGLVLLALGLKRVYRAGPRMILAAALLGIPLGAVLWTQPDAADLHERTQQQLERRAR